MSTVLLAIVGIALVAIIVAHLALLAAVFMSKPRYRGWVALVVPPLAPYWAWRLGVRRRVYVWGGALLFYAIGIAIVGR